MAGLEEGASGPEAAGMSGLAAAAPGSGPWTKALLGDGDEEADAAMLDAIAPRPASADLGGLRHFPTALCMSRSLASADVLCWCVCVQHQRRARQLQQQRSRKKLRRCCGLLQARRLKGARSFLIAFLSCALCINCHGH